MRVVLKDMPTRVKAFVKITAEPDGDFATVVCNSRLSLEQNQRSYIHEEKHLSNDDFAAESADAAERVRHEKDSNLSPGQQ